MVVRSVVVVVVVVLGMVVGGVVLLDVSQTYNGMVSQSVGQSVS